MKLLLSAFIFLACSTAASAQKLYGTIFNAQGDLLPYSSVTIKGTTKGTSANDKGKYSLAVAPGKYTVVCRRIGYALAEKEVTVDNNDTELSFILNEQKLTLETVVVNNKGKTLRMK
jgi:hypothetical protein